MTFLNLSEDLHSVLTGDCSVIQGNNVLSLLNPHCVESTSAVQITWFVALQKEHGLCRHNYRTSVQCKKKVTDFPVPSRDVTDLTLPLAGNILIIPGQGEFGQLTPLLRT
jgi:hypothetical protein